MTELCGSKEKIWTKDFTNIFIVSFIMNMGQFMMGTLIPKYAYQLGGEATVVGIVTGLFAVTALAIRPIAGPAMDYFRKNRLLSMAIGLISLSMICYGFARSITVLMIARLIHGLGMGVVGPLSLALVSNVLPRGKMASGLGVFSLGSAVSTAVGPTLGLKLSVVIGYNNVFFISALLMASCFVLSLQLKGEAPERGERFKISLKQIIAPEVLAPTVVILLQIIAHSGINSFIAIFGGLCGVEDIGLFFTASAVCLIIIRPLSGKIADRYGIDKTVIPGLLIFAAAFLLISVSRSLPMFLLAGAVSALGYGISEPIIQTMNMQLVPKERRGAAGNTNFMGIDLGFLVGPTLAGLVVTSVQERTGNELLGFAVMYKVMILPVIAALVIFALSRKKLLCKIKALQDASEAI
jgi:MFS family permease